MKKLLIIALLFWGCEGFGVFKHSHDGICIGNSNFNDYVCFMKYNRDDCYNMHWYQGLTCAEFCADVPSDESCEENNDSP